MERGLTLEGEKYFPSAIFFFLSFAHQFCFSGWCPLSKVISPNRLERLVQIQDKSRQREHTHITDLYFSDKQILHKHPFTSSTLVNGKWMTLHNLCYMCSCVFVCVPVSTLISNISTQWK